jgi:hypothetical protein
MKIVCKNQFYDGDTVLFECESKRGIICWLENLLRAVERFSLLSELNDIQSDCHGDDGKTVFPDKFEMPIKIINLVIQKFRLRVEEE